MKMIKSNADLNKFVNSSNGNAMIMGMNEKQIMKIMKDAADTIEKNIKSRLNDYFTSNPESDIYSRTGKTIRDITVGNPVRNIDGSWDLSIGLTSMHDSILGEGQAQGNTLSLLDTGWDVRDKNFTKFEGLHYIEDVVKEFNMNNPYGIKISVIRNGLGTSGVKFG